MQNKIIIRLRNRICGFLILNGCIAGLTFFLFFWGIAVLAFRCSGFDNLPFFTFLLFFAFAVIPCPVLYTVLYTMRKLPDIRQTAAILDWKNSAGGLLMASLETDTGSWTEELPETTVNILPRVSWNPKQSLIFLCASVVFALAAVFVPVSALSAAAAKHLNIENEVKRLTSQLNIMEEENLLQVDEVETRKNELEKIQQNAEGEGPVKTFDALDHIAEQLNQKAAEALEEAQRTTETLAKTETLINAVQEAGSGLDETEKKSLTEGLTRSLEKMLNENKPLAENLKEHLEKQTKPEQQKNNELSEALKKKLQENDLKDMTQEELQQLCETMKQCRNDAQRMCENLQKAGFPVNKESLEKLKQGQNVEKEEAERMLSDLWADCDACDGKQCDGEENGRKKVSPRFTKKQDWTTDPDAPPEDTKFEKNEDTEGAQFKAVVLPPADLEAFLNSKKIGTSVSAPDYDAGGVPAEHGGAVKNVSETEGSAKKQTIYPQHRGAVSRFFDK